MDRGTPPSPTINPYYARTRTHTHTHTHTRTHTTQAAVRAGVCLHHRLQGLQGLTEWARVRERGRDGGADEHQQRLIKLVLPLIHVHTHADEHARTHAYKHPQTHTNCVHNSFAWITIYKLSFPPRIYFPPECTLTFFLHALFLCVCVCVCVCIVFYGVLACIVHALC